MLYKRGKCDFPWTYADRPAHNKTKFGGGARTYDLISDDDAMNYWAPWIDSIFHPTQGVCFFWITWPKVEFCLEFVRACGFNISTLAFIWVKTLKNDETKFKPGVGTYTASNSELCLLGVRQPLQPVKKLVNQVYESFFEEPEVIKHPLVYGPDGKPIHSRKPEVFKERIDLMYPAWVFGKGIGLFEREPQGEDWHVFGNEVISDIAGPEYEPVKKTFKPAHDHQMRLDLYAG